MPSTDQTINNRNRNNSSENQSNSMESSPMESVSTEVPRSTDEVDYVSESKNEIPTNQNITMAPSVIATLDRQKKSSNDNNSGSGGSGNNSDNSGLVSMGNNSFGFNFDSEDAIGGTGNNSASSDQNDSDQSDTKETPNQAESSKNDIDDGDSNVAPSMIKEKKPRVFAEVIQSNPLNTSAMEKISSSSALSCDDAIQSPSPPSQPNTSSNIKDVGSDGIHPTDSSSSKPDNYISSMKSNEDAAAAAVESLRSVVRSSSMNWEKSSGFPKIPLQAKQVKIPTEGSPQPKTTARIKGETEEDESDEGGYHSDDEGDDNGDVNASSRKTHQQNTLSKDQPPRKKNKKIDNFKREERNAREKERSFRISRQINELRALLSSGGVIVPKGTKSSVLTEAANYIRMLQQHQYRSEIDRHQLIQQMQMIGAGALGPQAAGAIRHVAVQNGVWSLGNFGGVPPRSAMSFYNPGSSSEVTNANPETDVRQIKEIEEHEYRHVFNSCAVAMAIASMGGAFIDCNELFCQLSQYTKQEVCSMTIFNMTSRSDLQHAFDLISQMISPSSNSRFKPPPCVLQGSMKNRNDLGLSISLIKGENDGIAKCFCVTLVKNTVPFSSRPTPALSDLIQENPSQQTSNDSLQKPQSGGDMSSPAYTTG